MTTADQLRAVLTAIGGHNNFDARAASARFGPFVSELMRVEIQQWAGGPAIYFTLAPWEHQRLSQRHVYGSSGRKYSQAERQELAARIIAEARVLEADEITVAQFNGAQVLPDAVGKPA